MAFHPVSIPRSAAPLPHAARFTVVQAGILLLGILAAIYLALPIWLLTSPVDLGRNESWNAWFIDALQSGNPLYPSSNELLVNNYPPLSFYLTALVAKLTGDTILAGRLIALVSTFVVSAAAGLCVRALGGSRAASALAALWLLATLARFFTLYVGVNDPSLLGIALMGLGLAWFLQRMQARRSTLPAVALMVLAAFVKHNMPSLALAAIVWLAIGNKWAALRATLFGTLLSAAGVLICIAAFGWNFIEQILMPRHIALAHIGFALNRLQWVAPAVVVWGLWAWPNRNLPSAQFTALLLGLTLLNGITQAAGAGVTYNAYFGFVFASAVAVALAFDGIGTTALAKRFGTGAVQAAVIAVLVLRLLLWMRSEPYLVLISPSFREEVRQHERTMTSEVERIRAIPGNVNCWPLAVCYRAGKAFVYDQYWVEQFIATGRWTKEAVEQAVQEKGIRFESIEGVGIGKKLLF
jgi:hypothetical protein